MRGLADVGTIAVTGASGWLGMTAIELLWRALGEAGLRERVRAYASRERELRLRSGVTIRAAPLSELEPAEFLLHFAYLTRDRAAEPGYLADNLAITQTVLAALRHPRSRGVLYASSGAVYGAGDVHSDPYGCLKQLDELALRAAARDAAARCAVFRVFNLGGPYLAKPWGYVLGDLLLQARDRDRLTLRARHPVIRSYLHARDVVAVGLAWLLSDRRQDETVVDAAGSEVIEVGELARRVARACGRGDLEIEREWDVDAVADRYVGDHAAFAQLADQLGVERTPLDAVIADTAADVRWW